MGKPMRGSEIGGEVDGRIAVRWNLGKEVWITILTMRISVRPEEPRIFSGYFWQPGVCRNEGGSRGRTRQPRFRSPILEVQKYFAGLS